MWLRAEVRRLELFRLLYVAAGVLLLSAYVSLAASPIRQLTDAPATDVRPAWSPDGRRIAFQSNRDGPYHIYVMDADGSNVRQLTGGELDDRHPAWSPDGKYVAVDSGDVLRREIWLIEVATGARTQVTRLGAASSFPSWSPDGTRISFYVYQDEAMDLWTVVPDGRDLTRLTTNLASLANNNCTFACHAASWSPDSQRIAFSDGDHRRVLLMSVQTGGAQAAISPDDERSHFPIFLSDGRLVYVSEHVSQDQSWTDLWALDPDTGGPRSELVMGVKAQGPFELSADGRQLLFSSPRSGNFEIYAVTLDDAGKAALAARPEARPEARPAVTSPAPQGEPGLGLSADATFYLVALGVLALLVVGTEAAIRIRRRSKAKG